MRYLLTLLLSLSSLAVLAQSPPEVSWEFSTEEDSLQIPRTKIYLRHNAQKMLITTGMGNFYALEKAEFKTSQYQLPATAIAACSGFWAGLGHVLCVARQGKTWVVREGFLEEESPKGTRVIYKTIKKLTP